MSGEKPEPAPLPWAHSKKKFDDWGMIRDPNNILVCIARCPDDKDFDEHRRDGTDTYQQTIDRIVRSVNAVPDLVAALDQIKGVCEDNAPDSCDKRMALDFVRQVAAAAVAKVKP